MFNMKSLTTAVFLSLGIQYSTAAAVSVKSIALTNQPVEKATSQDSLIAAENFDCADEILAIVDIENADESAEELTYTWVNPSENNQEQYSVIVMTRDGQGTGLGNIKFHKGPGAEIFNFINPAMSLEVFIGEWELQISSRGKTIARKKFEVLC